ncbi:MerR family transcriptional regulator [Pseudonocardia spinosispora]|uniref:MerR family transcriptional regulator n=1 Tax=Pseudonocardia spinosispora TaxID=103441 RepID=UPI001FE1888B|nr:MerR family transcriptional regulator [Pseudonocardia spinosispora]
MSESTRCGAGRTPDETLRIGELSRRSGVSQRLLRYYEEQGLLTPSRRPSGYREYPMSSVATVRRIRGLLAAGLSTSTIATVLPCIRDDGERLVPTCPGLVADLAREKARIDGAIADLTASRDVLAQVIAAGPGGGDFVTPVARQAARSSRP